MKNWTIGKRITFGFGLVLGLVIISAVCSQILLGQISKISHTLVSDPLPGAEAMADLYQEVSSAHTAYLRSMLTPDPVERKKNLEEVVAAKKRVDTEIKRYDDTITLPEDRKQFDELKALRETYVSLRNQAIELTMADKHDEAIAFNYASVRPAYRALNAKAVEVLQWNFDSANKMGKQLLEIDETAKKIQITISCINIIVGLLFAITIITGLNRVLARLSQSLDEGANQVSSASSQVSASAQALAEGASEQAASIEETSASLTEVSSTIEHNSQTAMATKDLAQQTRQSAEQGAASTQEMDRSIAGIKAASQEMGTAMDAIKNASADIANIIKTIDEIAFQTNLLALNAAVEAARAGEAGAGFAVVADEVRNLAQRSAKAAKETAAMIETAIQRSNNGVAANQKVITSVEGVVAKSLEVSQKLQEIVGKVAQVDEQVAQIANASREQSQGIGQITTAVSQMEQVTQTNASGAEESAAAAEELNSQAEVLKSAVKELQALVGNVGKAASAPAAATATPTPKAKESFTIAAPRPKTFQQRSGAKTMAKN